MIFFIKLNIVQTIHLMRVLQLSTFDFEEQLFLYKVSSSVASVDRVIRGPSYAYSYMSMFNEERDFRRTVISSRPGRMHLQDVCDFMH